jgi:excisionase family DNA binding protein
MGNPYAFFILTHYRRFKMLETKDPLKDRPETYVTLKEAAKYLRVSYRTVYRWLSQGRLKFFRAGAGSTRIPLSELDKFIAENTSKTQTEE